MRILLRRQGDGIGDWLFMLTCIKHVNAQHPDVEIYVDFNMEPRQGRSRVLPTIVREAFMRSDVTFAEFPSDPLMPRSSFNMIVPHVVYGQSRLSMQLTYVESMLETFTSLLGLELRYDPKLVPKFVYPEYRGRPKSGYVAMVSKGKRETAHKDWPPHLFGELARDLNARSGRAIAHVGRTNDWALPHVERYFDCTFEELAGLLAGADLFIGLENGISVLASMLGTKTLVIYQKAGVTQRFGLPTVARMVRPPWNAVAAVAMKELMC